VNKLDNLPAELHGDGLLFLKIVVFLEKFDPIQIRYAGKEWRRLVKFVSRVAEISGIVRVPSCTPFRYRRMLTCTYSPN
jgi:hypothetical protein